MGKFVFAVVIAGTILLMGLSAFPGIKGALATDVTGMAPITAMALRSLPYALVFFIFYLAYLGFKNRGQSG